MEFATGALGILLPKLGELLQDEYNLQKGAKKDIEFLCRELESMRVALRKVGDVPPEQLDEQVSVWARNVRELSYDMEDIVDTFLVRVEGPDHTSKKSSKWFIEKIEMMVNMVTKAMTRHKIAQEIKDMTECVKEVAERRDRYKVDAITPAKTLVDPRITALYTKATDLVGIDEAREEVITRLMPRFKKRKTEGDGMAATQRKRIVSIAGFGGLGKTTLAKVVFDELKGQFDCTAFVSVSRNPDPKKVLKDMLYELDKRNYGNIHSSMFDEKHLIDLVQEFLQNKRYLIVIDDIWDIEPWKIIGCALIENSLGSRIITTTRIIDVAEHVGGCYKLESLSDESSRILFYGRIFGSEDKCPEQFLEVSKKILKKCGGVPLAIITTSSLLANKSGNIKEWQDVCDSIGSGLGSNNPAMDSMRKILLLSYYDLPSHLKTCLLYLSIFPEDYEIRKDRLICRWIAEGFVQHGQGDQSLFEVGESYLNELVNRSLIQLVEMMYDSAVPSVCLVHDTVLDLMCSLSGEECFVTTVFGDGKQNTPDASFDLKVRRLSLHNSTWPTVMDMAKVRSLTIFSAAVIDSMPSLSCYHLLRVLDLGGCNLENLPSLRFVENLFHLSYLSLYGTGYAGELPVEREKLPFLQTLELCGTKIEELSSSIVGLRQLMHLTVTDGTRLPNGLRNLTSLQTLWWVSVNSACIAEELGHLTQLRTLRVSLKKDEEGRWDKSLCKTLVESLGKLHKIESLVISSDYVAADLEGTVESLGNLRWLGIYRTSWLPSWINHASLPLLSRLHILVGQLRSEDIQVLGMLPALRYLEVEVDSYTQVVKRFVVGPHAFQCAVRCYFCGFTGVVPSMFPRGAMPRLEELVFDIRLEDFCSGELLLTTTWP